MTPKCQTQEAPSPKKPYDVQVVLHIVENRFLTPLFQDQLQKEVHDRLQLALGKLARVKVARTHRLLSDIETDGLGTVLDNWNDLSSTRTVFLLLEYDAGRYRLQTRQHDGLTGLASPRVREALVSDRARLAQTMVDLVRRDFGLTGAVTAVAGADVTLSVHAGELEPDLSAWVQPGRVFAVCRLSNEGDGLRSTPLAWTYLEVLPGGVEKGLLRCRLWRRSAAVNLQAAPGVAGYRCLLLPPSQGPVRLRFLKEESLDYWPGLVIHVKKPGAEKAIVFKSTDVGGLVEDKTLFSNLMLVLIPSGDRAQVIPVVPAEDRTIVISLREDTEAEERAALDDRLRQWERRLVANGQLVNQRLRDINEQILNSFDLALQTATLAGKELEKELDHLAKERDQLQSLAVKLKAKALNLEPGRKMLLVLEERTKEMQERAARYDHVLKDTKESKELGLKGALEKAKLHESLAEFDQAILFYQTLTKASPELAKALGDHLEGLKKDWEIKNPAHKKARAFFLKDWPSYEPLDLAKQLPRADKELAVLESAGDRLTPLRLRRANEAHADKIQKKLEALARDRNEDSRNQEKILRAAARDLADLETKARTLSGKKGKK